MSNVPDPTFSVRTMRREDLQFSFAASVEEDWNIGLHDHDCFYATDPKGFFIGEIDGAEGKIPVGSVSGVAYGTAFGFLGIYIVRPPYRGKGCGRRLFTTALDSLRQRGVETIGLDGVVAQQENYRRSGFEAVYRNIRYGGISRADLEAASSPGCVPLSSVPFDELEAYDRRHFPAPRTAFLHCWIRQPESVGYAFVENGRLAGYGMIRPSTQGWLIAPLFADDQGIADILFRALAGARPNAPIFIDVPEPNAAVTHLVEAQGLKPVFETARMYAGTVPDLPLHETYGITSLELG